MKQTEIKVLMVEPMKEPKAVALKTDLDSLQKAVSIGVDYQGLIEIISLGDGTCILCNEEGKLNGLDGNRRVGNDIIAGVFYVVGENHEKSRSAEMSIPRSQTPVRIDHADARRERQGCAGTFGSCRYFHHAQHL